MRSKKIRLKKIAGVTMVALAVMIIILLILAGIVINLAIENNGIIMKAKQATELYKQSEEREGKELNNLYNQLSSLGVRGSEEVNVEKISEIINQVVDNKIREEKLKQYPIGSIYISENEISPSEFIGGTWESYAQGRTLVGVGKGNDNTIVKNFENKEIGGEYNHLLTIDEIPSHSGHIYKNPRDKGNCDYYININNNATKAGYNFGLGWKIYSNNELYPVNYDIGGSQAHNNIQPYIVVYMWKRTS